MPVATLNTLHIDVNNCRDVRDLAEQVAELSDALGNPGVGGDVFPVWQDKDGNIIGSGVAARPVNIILARVNQLGGIPAGNSTFPFLFVADLYGTSGLVTGDEGEAVNTSLRALLNNENVRLVTYDGAIWLADKVGENVIVATVKGTLTSGSVTKNDQYFYFEAQYPISGTLPESGNSAGVVINQPPSDYAANETIVIELTDGTVHGFRIWKMVENDDVVGSGGGGSYEAGLGIDENELTDGSIALFDSSYDEQVRQVYGHDEQGNFGWYGVDELVGMAMIYHDVPHATNISYTTGQADPGQFDPELGVNAAIPLFMKVDGESLRWKYVPANMVLNEAQQWVAEKMPAVNCSQTAINASETEPVLIPGRIVSYKFPSTGEVMRCFECHPIEPVSLPGYDKEQRQIMWHDKDTSAFELTQGSAREFVTGMNSLYIQNSEFFVSVKTASFFVIDVVPDTADTDAKSIGITECP